MIVLLDPAHWVTRIQAQCPAFAQRVHESIDIDPERLSLHGTPMALVHTAADDSQPSRGRDAIEQIHDYQMAVKTVVRKTYSQSDLTHSQDAQLIRACRQELFNGLLGWLPPDAKQRVQHINGKQSEKGDFLIWTDLFTTRDLLRKPYG
jgi:hypothetical protein